SSRARTACRHSSGLSSVEPRLDCSKTPISRFSFRADHDRRGRALGARTPMPSRFLLSSHSRGPSRDFLLEPPPLVAVRDALSLQFPQLQNQRPIRQVGPRPPP